tara:strand:+ start:530 stop:949 length:420 start_codon:yes stop_codon:yes gene_type:complete
MNEVKLTDLFNTTNNLGSVYRIMRKSDENFSRFGEVYITTIKPNLFKGWKKHKKNTTNLAVPHGNVKVITINGDQDKSSERSFILSPNQYRLLTIPPGYWFGMKNIASYESIIVNFSDFEHNLDEVITKDINFLRSKDL